MEPASRALELCQPDDRRPAPLTTHCVRSPQRAVAVPSAFGGIRKKLRGFVHGLGLE
jgi:hypothetical protein